MELTDLLSIENLVFCLVISLAVKALRFIVDKFWKNAENNNTYRDVFLPVAPILIGAILAFSHFPIMAVFTINRTARIFFGAVAGLLSAHTFAMFKRLTTGDQKE